jgi:hypothetical protein
MSKKRRARLEVEEVCLVDDKGQERLTLTVDPESGCPSITLRDQKSRGRLSLSCVAHLKHS